MRFYCSECACAWLIATLASLLLASCSEQPAKPAFGLARFEFLTPSLVRMEYAPKAAFVDVPSVVVQKRDWPSVPVASSTQDGWLTLSSSALTLRYKLNSGPFTHDNLRLTWINPSGTHTWQPGDVDTRNLGGLSPSLDNVGDGDAQEQGEPGLLSRSGYALIDDSRTPVWNAQHTWIQPRTDPSGQDWYLFTYDDDYQSVFNAYALLCGPIPMIPRYALGTWITDFNFEYFPASPESTTQEVERYSQRHLEEELVRLHDDRIPIDTLVLDFAWHDGGWNGGYDWSPLIPQPEQFIHWLHDRGIKLSLNDHPGYAGADESVLSYQDRHAPQVLQDLGWSQPLAPMIDIDLSDAWKFSADPNDRGLHGKWYATGYPDESWTHVRNGESWQGYKRYGGVAWYRASFQLPKNASGSLYLWLGAVRGTYRLFVNGQEVSHSPAQWPSRLTYADVAPYIKPGSKNEIVLRIQRDAENGNILGGPTVVRDVAPPKRITFDLSDPKQAGVFMHDLHEPLLRAGVNVWWVDGDGGRVAMPGLDQQLWTNKVFYDFTQQTTGQRGFILSRYGGWGGERYPAFFTGDTYSRWPVLAYEVAFTARGGNVLMPYISQDIGGFHGAKIDFDLFARWVEFGAFSPILRMHGEHANPREGNLRMPWVYGDKGVALMRKYFTLRTQMIPYIYSYTWQAHMQSMPLLRPLYLEYPNLEEAYHHAREYFFGSDMVVAPVLDPSGDRTVYLPPGKWIDFFTGQHYDGGASFTAHYAVDDMPVFVREGAIVPEQPISDYSDAEPLDTLIVNVYGSGFGNFHLYEDDGLSLAYAQGQYATTAMHYVTDKKGLHQLIIEPTLGTYRGQPTSRAYELRIHAGAKPQSITADGQAVSNWTWNAQDRTTVVELPARSVTKPMKVLWQ